jgi:hypothetical protein
MGRLGRECSARFDWQEVAAQYEGVYELARRRIGDLGHASAPCPGGGNGR